MLWVVHGAERNPSQSVDLFESGNQIGFVTILLNSPICRRLGRRPSRDGVTQYVEENVGSNRSDVAAVLFKKQVIGR